MINKIGEFIEFIKKFGKTVYTKKLEIHFKFVLISLRAKMLPFLERNYSEGKHFNQTRTRHQF